MRSGYCYGKRVAMYAAQAYFANVHEDLYDSSMALWKVVNIGLRTREDRLHPEWGPQYFGGGIIEQYWNLVRSSTPLTSSPPTPMARICGPTATRRSMDEHLEVPESHRPDAIDALSARCWKRATRESRPTCSGATPSK